VPGQGRRQVVRSANASGKDVIAAAARLHTPLTRGDLAFFNGAYKARRAAAAARGVGL
jgi:hypothetical protein